MTNREWLNSLSNEDLIKWLYSREYCDLFLGDKPKSYSPTKYQVCCSHNASDENVLALWLEQERDTRYDIK